MKATVDHSEIRGLDTACHVFVAELPLSELGSLGPGPDPIAFSRVLLTVVAPLGESWQEICIFVRYLSVI